MADAQKATSFADLPVAVKLLLVLVGIGLVAVVMYFALLKPRLEEIDNAEGYYFQLTEQEAAATARQQEFLELTDELTARQAQDRQNRRVLPEEPEIAAFLQDLNGRAELSGLQIRLVEPRPEEPQALYVRIPVSLKLRGRFHQLAKFFFNISRVERAINMENVRLTEPAIEGEEVLLEADVMATTFRRLTEEEVAAQSATAEPAQ
ncbi:MAG: type 4a pilus biogenesis protein PilO [Myxococcota bacterium]